jgi:UDP-N-acetylmuramyl pentapeptide phosphotransferase/UDP-N-acetylglucosamine-1-phosphate transferase
VVRYGKNITENESVMAIVFLFPLVLLVSFFLFKKFGWTVTNYKGDETPYNLGFCIFIAVLAFFFVIDNLLIILYLTTLWFTGFIDDRFGTKYPKGLKGHISLFIATGKITTGLVKLVSTVTVSSLFLVVSEGGILERSTLFLLLVLPPHVMNLFDTRPLRVWKILAVHFVIYFPIMFQPSFRMSFSLGVIIAFLIYFEGRKYGMLGDNGATLLGGIVSIVAIYQLSISLQWLLICFYLLIVLLTEKISISEWIEQRPFLRRIDRWGVS